MANTLMGRLCGLHMVTYILVIVGALNWGLVGAGWMLDMNLNLVNILFGTWPIVEYWVYLIVGISAIVMLFQSSCTYCAETKV